MAFIQTRVPNVSIGLPVYNGENYLRDAIESVRAQTMPDFELIISDNASTDGTESICREYVARDPRIRYYRNPTNLGAARNYSRLVSLASAKYFAWLSHDDVYAPQFLERCLAGLEAKPLSVLCFPRSGRIDARGRQIEAVDYPMRVEHACPHVRFWDLIRIEHDCTAFFGVIRREVLLRTALMGAYVGSDRNLIAEAALHGTFHQVPERLFFLRIHPGRSVVACSEEDKRLAWFDPRQASGIHLHKWRPLLEYCRSIRRAGLAPGVQLWSLAAVIRLASYRRSELWRDLVEAGRKLIRRYGLSRPESWDKCVEAIQARITKIVPAGADYLLLDQEALCLPETLAGRRRIPFPERNGYYAGLPVDGRAAVTEFERSRAGGADYLVIASPAFWWLDHYVELQRHLREHYRRIYRDRHVVVFNLVKRPGGRSRRLDFLWRLQPWA